MKNSKKETNYIRDDAWIDSVIEKINDGILSVDENGIIKSANQAIEQIFGYASEEIVGENISIFLSKSSSIADKGWFDSNINKADLHNEDKQNWHGVKKDGSVFPIDLTCFGTNIVDQKICTAIIRDLSITKELEEIIFAKDMRISTLVDAFNDGIIVFDEFCVIEIFNPAAEKLFGYSLDEVKLQNVSMILPGSYSSSHNGYVFNFSYCSFEETTDKVFEVIGKRKDGSVFPVDIVISEMTISGEKYFSGVIRDLSERKLLEEIEEKKRALEITTLYERTQSKVMELFSSSFDARSVLTKTLALLHEEHHFAISAVYLFSEWEGVLECVAKNGMPDNHEERQSSKTGLLGQAVTSRKSILLTTEDEIPFKIETGIFTIIPAAVSVSPIIYREKVLGVLVLAKTNLINPRELKFIEHLTEQLGLSLFNIDQYINMEMLSDQLRKRGQEISLKNVMLERANRLKTDFLANMSHELRTPLNAIIGFSEVLKDEMWGKLNTEQADYTGEILSSANHLLSLINDILDLSKIESGKMYLCYSMLNISDLLENSFSVVKELAHEKGISLNLIVSDDLGDIEADPRKMKQIIFNLLSNAVKFTHKNGTVTVEAKRVDENLQIKVSDTGIGIAPEKISSLFESFEQIDSSLSREYEGTGLGLSLVKKFVELHGGQVGVNSVQGKGSCFYCTIPYRPKDNKDFRLRDKDESLLIPEMAYNSKASLKELNFKPMSNNGIDYTVLILENDEYEASLLKSYLEEIGYHVNVALNSQEGIDSLKNDPPDVVTIDLLKSDTSGFEFLDIKNRMPLQYSSIPVMIFSSVDGAFLMADAVMSKPIKRLNLLSWVEKILDQPKAKNYNSKPKILLIDDDAKAVKILSSYFPQQDYEVICAFNGADGIELTKIEKPDLVILDLIMPGISGFEVLVELNQTEKSERIPVCVLTAHSLNHEEQQDLREKVEAVCHDGKLGKPLFSEVKIILEKYKRHKMYEYSSNH